MSLRRQQEEISGRSEGLGIEVVAALEERVEEALAAARAAEAAAVGIGAAALDAAERARDAAEQARRAAKLAERAGAIAGPPRRSGGGRPPRPIPGGDALGEFSARADRLQARLRELERLPLSA